jgi:hypothetical protein
MAATVDARADAVVGVQQVLEGQHEAHRGELEGALAAELRVAPALAVPAAVPWEGWVGEWVVQNDAAPESDGVQALAAMTCTYELDAPCSGAGGPPWRAGGRARLIQRHKNIVTHSDGAATGSDWSQALMARLTERTIAWDEFAIGADGGPTGALLGSFEGVLCGLGWEMEGTGRLADGKLLCFRGTKVRPLEPLGGLKSAAQLFELFDADGDGAMDSLEYRRFLETSGAWGSAARYTGRLWSSTTWPAICAHLGATDAARGVELPQFEARYAGRARLLQRDCSSCDGLARQLSRQHADRVAELRALSTSAASMPSPALTPAEPSAYCGLDVHSHRLVQSDRLTSWYCDVCTESRRPGITTARRYRCMEGCDFDMCAACWRSHGGTTEGGASSTTRLESDAEDY